MEQERSAGPEQADPGLRSFYRRRLPHWQPEGTILFVTCRLANSLPASAIQRLAEERAILLREPVRSDETPRDRSLRMGRRLFELADEALDQSLSLRGSPRWLEDERVARMMCDSLRFWDGVRYSLHRYVVMPNHVHLLMEPLLKDEAVPCADGGPGPRWPLAKIMQGLKGYTSREANRLLGRHGAFWQDESFDHWVRDEADYHRVRAYIDLNPVVAGLCATLIDWPWSSAAEELHTSV